MHYVQVTGRRSAECPPGGFQNKYDNLAPPCRKPTRRRGRHKRLPAASRHERDASLSPGPAAGQVSHSGPLSHLPLPWQPRAQLLNKSLREAHRAPSETLAAAVRAATLDPSQHTSRDEYFLDESGNGGRARTSFRICSLLGSWKMLPRFGGGAFEPAVGHVLGPGRREPPGGGPRRPSGCLGSGGGG